MKRDKDIPHQSNLCFELGIKLRREEFKGMPQCDFRLSQSEW